MLALLLSYLLLYKYIALFIIVFFGSVIMPLPLSPLLLATGAFASFGYFNIAVSIILVVLANVSADMLDYLIAKHYGQTVFEKFKVKKNYYFENLEHNIREHASMTIFITRFVGPLDILGSLFAGSIGIPITTFIFYDFLGNVLSNCIPLMIGYFAGSYWQNFSGLINIIGSILFIAVILFLIIQVFLRRRRHTKRLVDPLNTTITRP